MANVINNLSKLLPQNGSHPRKKFRGKKRYYKKLNAFNFHRESNWWNFWHYHPDYLGWGNKSLAFRKENIRTITDGFRKIAQSGIEIPFQTWIEVSTEDACYDAVYVNSKTEHSVFPYIPDGITWGITEFDLLLKEYLPEYNMIVGKAVGSNDIATYYFYSPDVGESLECSQ